jgi:hypothetical protein
MKCWDCGCGMVASVRPDMRPAWGCACGRLVMVPQTLDDLRTWLTAVTNQGGDPWLARFPWEKTRSVC